MGATVLNGADQAVLADHGAGALVTEGKSFPPGSLIVGSPARVARALSPEQSARLRLSANGYAARARVYAGGLTRVDR